MKVYELYEKPGTWVQGHFASDKDGNSVPPEDKDAASWCFLGALSYCYGYGADRMALRLKLMAELKDMYETQYVTISDWNDDSKRTQAEVAALCKRLDI